MKKMVISILILCGFAARADYASDLLKDSDIGRGGVKQGLVWNIKIETHEEGDDSLREFVVKAKDHDALVDASAPARNKGEVYLFNDRMMWFYKPGLKKPVGISSRQKMTGQTANGDIASTHYARDYVATVEKTEMLAGEKMHVLMLKASAQNLTYDRIRYWVSDKDHLAKKAEFLTLQGQAFKIGEFEYKNEIIIEGKKYPFVSLLKITDAKFPENRSVIKYESPMIQDLPESLFNVNRLSR